MKRTSKSILRILTTEGNVKSWVCDSQRQSVCYQLIRTPLINIETHLPIEGERNLDIFHTLYYFLILWQLAFLCLKTSASPPSDTFLDLQNLFKLPHCHLTTDWRETWEVIAESHSARQIPLNPFVFFCSPSSVTVRWPSWHRTETLEETLK